MLRHLVLLRFVEGTTDDQRRAVAEGLASLPDAIPEIRTYSFGPDLALRDGTWDWAIAATFDDAAAWARYQDHPAHQAFLADVIRPVLAERAAVQYEG